MSQQEKDTAFFRALLSGHGEQECRSLQSRLHETERNQRSVRRAAFLAAVLGLFSLAGLGYSALFRPEILGDSSHFLVRLFSVTGLTSLICMTGFLGYWLHFRQMASRLHDECRAFFLEIGDMTLATQAKVLRVIESQVFQRVGGGKNIGVDVRILGATNKDLLEEVRKGNFRGDLYFRLNLIPIMVPPLRDRKSDIPLLVEHFMERFAVENGTKTKDMAPEVVKMFQEYEWPGNIRELKNAVERLMIMVPSAAITKAHVVALGMLHSKQVYREYDYFSYKTLKEARDAFERDFIIRKLHDNDWNVSKTSSAIDIERSNLHKKIKSYGIRETST